MNRTWEATESGGFWYVEEKSLHRVHSSILCTGELHAAAMAAAMRSVDLRYAHAQRLEELRQEHP